MLFKDPPVKITDNLWMLGTGAYPLFLVQGEEEGAIFEGGTGPMGPLLCEQIEQLAITTDSVKQVVITHAHPDHVMAVPFLREIFPAAVVVASQIAAKTLSAEKAISFFCQIDDALSASLSKAGLITQKHRRQPLPENRIAVDRLVKQGDAIAVDGLSFDVLETPGHSDCSLSFHEPRRGILFVSDATGYYLPEHDFWWPNYFVDYDTYLKSIRRLAGLGAGLLCLSHNAVVQGADHVEDYFRRAMAATEQYHRQITAEAKAGKSVREIAEQLGREVYEKTQLLPLDFFQKNCGLLVKKSLKHEGIQA